MGIIIITVQIIALLLLVRTIQENTIELKKSNTDDATIKATNQRTIIIFLLMEIIAVTFLLNLENITSLLKQGFLQL